MAGVETQSQPQQPPFGNSIRGDVSTCRFDVQHAAPALPDKNMRRIISHEFDAQKAQQNVVSLDKQAEKPHGQRWNASNEWHEKHLRRRSQQEQEEEQKQVKHISDTLAGILKQLPEYQTSGANPLRPETAPAADSAEDDSAADSAESRKPCRTVSFIERSHDLKGHLEVGSLAPAGAAADAVTAEGEALIAAAVEKEKRQQLLVQLAEQILKEYPHGVPKRLQLELRSRGIVLPSLGFGQSHSSTTQDAKFSQR